MKHNTAQHKQEKIIKNCRTTYETAKIYGHENLKKNYALLAQQSEQRIKQTGDRFAGQNNALVSIYSFVHNDSSPFH
jgi:aspartyl aminopeptidase